MIPFLYHEARARRWPYATICLVGLNLLAFLFETTMGPRFYPFLQEWGLVPARVSAEISVHNLLTILTSMFLHVGWLHVFFNLLFLLVFGEAVEGALGWAWFLFLYVMAGLCGDVAFMMVDSSLAGPAVGASGAIAGVMAASLVLWPRARLHIFGLLWLLYLLLVCMGLSDPLAHALGLPTWVIGGPIGVALAFATMLVGKRGLRFMSALTRIVSVPAWVVIALFLVANLMYEGMSLISPDLATNVGWQAHFGGFVVGAVLAWVFPKHPVALKQRALLE